MSESAAPLGPWKVASSSGTSFTFSTPAEIHEFAQEEYAKWEWASPHQRQPFGSELWRAVDSLRQVNKTLEQFQDQPDRGVSAALADLQEYLRFNPPLHPHSPLQKYVLDICKRDAREAYATLVWRAKRIGSLRKKPTEEQLNQDEHLSGLANAILFESDATAGDKAGALISQLAREVSNAQAHGSEAAQSAAAALTARQEAQAHSGEVASEASNLKAKIAESGRRMAEEFDSTLQNAKDATLAAVSELKASTTSDWKRLTETYDAQLALQAPSTYWRDRYREHSKLAKGFALASGAASVLLGGAILWLYSRLFGSLLATTVPTWSQVLTVTVTAVLYLWTIKSFVRLTMSHIHLAIDAAERRTMILSYLAISRKKEVSSEDLRLLFASIFRPSGDGIVKDEAPPFPLIELLKGK